MLSFFKDFPPLVRTFLLRFFVLFVLFESLIYFAKEKYEALNQPLTKSVALSSVLTLQKIHPTKIFDIKSVLKIDLIDGEPIKKLNQLIICNKIHVLLIADSCNGFELYMLYIGFLLSIPIGNFRTKTLFILLGTPFLYGINVIRCIGLIELQLALNKYFDFYHHYLFKATIYSFIFGLWVLFVKRFETPKSAHGIQ